MPKIQRKAQKIFSGGANGDQIAVFGTMKTGTPTYSNDLDSLQSAEYEQGWSDAILNDKAPYLEEMNGVQYGLSTQIAYILQQGLACEWNKDTLYYKGSIVAVISGTNVNFYKSITDDNRNHSPESDGGTNWVLDSISKIETYKTNLDNAISTLDSQVVKLTGNQSIAGTKTFTSAPYVPNSTAAGTALRLVGKGGGYIKLGDGTLIQWGSEKIPGNNYSKSVSLYQSYASAVYRIFLTNTGTNNNAYSDLKVTTISNISFQARSSTYDNYFNWLSIGQWY